MKKQMKRKKRTEPPEYVVGRTAVVTKMLMSVNPKPKPTSKVLVVPKGYKPSVIKKFRTKDKRKRLLVVRLPNEQGHAIHSVSKVGLSGIRVYGIPPKSEVPTPILMSVSRELAIWCARFYARHGELPSVRKERTRRKRYTRKAVAVLAVHQATKSVVDKIGKPTVPFVRQVLPMLLPFICIYDPKCRRNDPVFHVHAAYCSRLEHARKKFHKRGGTSWVIEAKTPAEAIALQVAEFKEDDRGYEAEDFKFHGCVTEKGEEQDVVKKKKTRTGRVHQGNQRGADAAESGHGESSEASAGGPG